MIGVVIVALWVDRTGRRLWFTTCFVVLTAIFVFLYVSGGRSVTEVFVGMCVADIAMASISSLIFLYSAEIYPTRLRSRGVAIAGSWQKVGIVAGQLSIGYIVQGFGIAGVFLQCALSMTLGGVVVLLFCVEARNRALEEVSP